LPTGAELGNTSWESYKHHEDDIQAPQKREKIGKSLEFMRIHNFGFNVVICIVMYSL
jgi:hypothetical protein